MPKVVYTAAKGLHQTSGSGYDIQWKDAPEVGAGISAAAALCETKVYETNGIVYTRILVDIEGLTSASTDTSVIGKTGGTAASHLIKLDSAVNGLIYDAHMYCLETPTTGEVDLNLVADTTSTAQGANATDIIVVDAGGDWALGKGKRSALTTAYTAGLHE